MRFALVGHKIQHSLSPKLQELNAKVWGEIISFDLLDLNPAEFEGFLNKKEWQAYQGLNVTTPYKEKVYPVCAQLSASALCLGAVNTLKCEGGKLHGHNTDHEGVEFLLNNLPNSVKYDEARVVLLGVGGASRAAAYALNRLGVGHLLWISRDQERAKDCIKWCNSYFPRTKATWLGPQGETLGDQFDNRHNTILISGAPPLKYEAWEVLATQCQSQLGTSFGLNHHAPFIDLNYGNNRTKGSRAYCVKHNLKPFDGLSMLVGQGVSSFEWWTGFRPSPKCIYEQMQKIN